MSVHIVYKQNGVKMMRPVLTREEYMKLRNGGFQQDNVARIRQGDELLIEQKRSVVWIHFAVRPSGNRRRCNFKR